jgi:hypothetical protein
MKLIFEIDAFDGNAGQFIAAPDEVTAAGNAIFRIEQAVPLPASVVDAIAELMVYRMHQRSDNETIKTLRSCTSSDNTVS